VLQTVHYAISEFVPANGRVLAHCSGGDCLTFRMLAYLVTFFSGGFFVPSVFLYSVF
jgi:hypothetical protein